MIRDRCREVRRMYEMGNPMDVLHHDMNAYIDVSDQHRQEMRQILYSKHEKLYDASHRKVPDFFRCSYGDEEPPKWETTTQAAYVPKPLSLDTFETSKAIATERKNAHFSLEAGDAPENQYVSSTRREFKGIDVTMVPRTDYRVFLKNYHNYPPIYRDEADIKITKEQKYPVHEYIHQTRHSKGSKSQKSASHISLGTDPTEWTSVTKSAMIEHELVEKPPSDYELLEKKKSTVLDNPDLVPPPWQSVHQSVFQISNDLDRSTLTVDNTKSIKDLKSTHFSLGSGSSEGVRSQYQSAYKPSVSVERAKPVSKAGASPRCIIVEDYEDRRLLATTTQQQDFQPHESTYSSSAASKIKAQNSKSSIWLGEGGGLGTGSISVSKKDYKAPSDTNSELAAHAYSLKDHTKKIATFSSIDQSFEDYPDHRTKSVQSSDYKKPEYIPYKKVLADLSRPNPVTHGAEHLHEFVKDRQASLMKQHFVDPSSQPVEPGNAPTRKLVSRSNDNFENTLKNTIGRDVHAKGDFTTVMQETFTNKSDFVERRSSFPPPQVDIINEHLHPQVVRVEQQDGDVSFKRIREFSTNTRRTFVPPEVMKFM